MNKYLLKAIINKKNNQINFSLPRKQLPPDVIKNIEKKRFLRIKLW